MVKLKMVKGAALDQAEQSGQLSVPVFRINAMLWGNCILLLFATTLDEKPD
jgi:hypothetical protein